MITSLMICSMNGDAIRASWQVVIAVVHCAYHGDDNNNKVESLGLVIMLIGLCMAPDDKF